MYNPYHRNNCSLFDIPQSIKEGRFNSGEPLRCWSVHTWVRDDRFLPSFYIWINYSFRAYSRSEYRAFVKNIWSRSDRIEIWQFGIRLEGDELKAAKLEVINRLKRLCSYSSLRNKEISRYRFNYIASFPEGSLAGLDCHHESHDNVNMRAYCVDHGVFLRDEWFIATDDRIDNLVRIDRFEHKLIHFANGDTGFIPYLSHYAKPDSNSESLVDVSQIAVQNVNCENEVNKGNHSASDSICCTSPPELWALFLEAIPEYWRNMQISPWATQTSYSDYMQI